MNDEIYRRMTDAERSQYDEADEQNLVSMGEELRLKDAVIACIERQKAALRTKDRILKHVIARLRGGGEEWKDSE